VAALLGREGRGVEGRLSSKPQYLPVSSLQSDASWPAVMPSFRHYLLFLHGLLEF
jgi:hypothetical protein